jgi:hypothetical protein
MAPSIIYELRKDTEKFPSELLREDAEKSFEDAEKSFEDPQCQDPLLSPPLSRLARVS